MNTEHLHEWISYDDKYAITKESFSSRKML